MNQWFRETWRRHQPLRHLVLRRLLVAIPTLFGIVLVTFGLLHLAPAEPGAGTGPGALRAGAMTAEAAENFQRTFGFDLPVFLNLDVQDRGRRVARSLGELTRPSTAAQAQRRLVTATTLIFPEAAGHLARRDSPRLRDALDRVLEIIGVARAKRLALRRGPPGGYLHWWRARAGEFRPAAIRAAVDALASGQTGAADRVWRLHKRAVPALVTALLRQDQDPAARFRLSRILGRITGHAVIYDPAAPRPERRSVLGQWRDFWRAEETVYRDLSGWERFTGAVTRTRFARWLGRLIRGDFGESSYFRRRAWDVIAERLPVTLLLNGAALFLAYLLSIPLGVWSAVRRDTWRDRLVTTGLFVLYALPTFWVALMLVIFLGGIEGPDLFPTSGLHSFHPADYPLGSAALDLLWHVTLPIFCLTYGALAVVSRYQRAGMIEVLGQDYIRTARAKGLSEGRVVWRHGLRNGIIPLVNLLGLQIPYLLSGSVIIETVFDIPGMGSLAMTAILQRDTNVLMGIVSVTAVLTLLGLLLSDLLMLWADPRISFQRKGDR